MRMRRGLIVLGVIGALVVAGAGVALVDGGRDGGRSQSDVSAGGGSVAVAPEPAGDGAMAYEASGSALADPGSSGGGRDAATSRSEAAPGANGLGGLPTPELSAHVIKTASVELEVGRKEGRSTVHAIVDAVGLVNGFVESTDQSGGFARMTVRVPAAEFDATLARMRELGRERNLQIHGEDVTGTVTDLEARLRNLRAQEAVLLNLMGKATTIGDSIAVQQQLSQNQEQIEQLEGQRRALADQTTFASISVSVRAKGAPVPAEARATGLGAAWDDAIDAAVAVVGGMLVVLGAVLPLALLAGLGLLAWRLVVRHRRPRPAAPAAG